MKLSILQKDFERCGINPTIFSQSFASWKDLPKENGLYSIWQGNICIYVGQAAGKKGILGRFNSHYNKAYAIESAGTTHTKAWKANRLREDWDPLNWTVEYFFVERAVHRTYIEGVMMLEFDPLCNDENYADRINQ